MSEPATAHISLSATGYADGLGRRTLDFDREAGGMLERLRLRPEFGAFEAALRQRMDRVAACDDARFARVRAVERDPSGAVTVVSAYAVGDLLCDLEQLFTVQRIFERRPRGRRRIPLRRGTQGCRHVGVRVEQRYAALT